MLPHPSLWSNCCLICRNHLFFQRLSFANWLKVTWGCQSRVQFKKLLLLNVVLCCSLCHICVRLAVGGGCWNHPCSKWPLCCFMFLRPAYHESFYHFSMLSIGWEMLRLHYVKCWMHINSWLLQMCPKHFIQPGFLAGRGCLCPSSFLLDQMLSILLAAESWCVSNLMLVLGPKVLWCFEGDLSTSVVLGEVIGKEICSSRSCAFENIRLEKL